MRVATKEDIAQKNLWVAGIIDVPATDLARRNGFALDSYDEDGLGRALGQALVTNDNLIFSIEQLLDAPGHYALQTKILCEGDDKPILQANLIRILNALAVTPREIDWVQDGLSRQEIRQKVGHAAKPPIPAGP